MAVSDDADHGSFHTLGDLASKAGLLNLVHDVIYLRPGMVRTHDDDHASTSSTRTRTRKPPVLSGREA